MYVAAFMHDEERSNAKANEAHAGGLPRKCREEGERLLGASGFEDAVGSIQRVARVDGVLDIPFDRTNEYRKLEKCTEKLIETKRSFSEEKSEVVVNSR